jgi:Fe-S-cluster containining protein
MCGECCFGEGGIFLTDGEIERIARFLELSLEQFVAVCCETRHGRLYISTEKDGFCLFYKKGKGCAIHPVKPHRCELWPFYEVLLRDEEAWRIAMDACPGLNPQASHEDFTRQYWEEFPEP